MSAPARLIRLLKPLVRPHDRRVLADAVVGYGEGVGDLLGGGAVRPGGQLGDCVGARRFAVRGGSGEARQFRCGPDRPRTAPARPTASNGRSQLLRGG